MITPISHHRISEQSKDEHISQHPYGDHRESKSPTRSSNAMSQSLASVDSEGSWLTGKPVKRGLSNRSGLRISEPAQDSAAQPGSNSEDDIEKREGFIKSHGQVARHAQLQRGVRVRSSEGLLKEAITASGTPVQLFDKPQTPSVDNDSDDAATPDAEHPNLHRARSVKSTKESAKLVDVGRKGVVQNVDT
jgi:hypothetical protein